MRIGFAAALALTLASPIVAQTSPATTDLSYAVPAGGNWSYVPGTAVSEAIFTDASGASQLAIRCTRATRRVTISRPAPAASDGLSVWTSSQTKNIVATFDSASRQITATLAPFDPLLDAIAGSRGRIGFSTSGGAPLVVPPWPEIGRVVEDCRA
jgi:hypothetical protein